MRLSFGRCILDTDSRELIVGGQPRHLTMKVYQLLSLLLEQRPRALSKSELHEHLWPGIFVSESALSSLVAELRQAIDDSSQETGRLIRTIHGHGYAFSGQVSIVPESIGADAPEFRLVWGNREVPLAEGDNILGRMREALLWIDDPSVSRRHAVVTVRGRAVTIVDSGSKNGTLVNGHPVAGSLPLQAGDVITVGPATLTFKVYLATGPTETAHHQL